MLQKFAICLNVSEVFSTSHTAVAIGINGAFDINYFSLLKFGIARCTSDAAHEIREKLIDREEAISLVNRYDDEYPSKKSKEIFLKYTSLTEDQLIRIENRWRNRRLWSLNSDGNWKLNFTIK